MVVGIKTRLTHPWCYKDVLVKENKVTNTCVATPHTQMHTPFLTLAPNSRFSQLCLIPEASLHCPLIPIRTPQGTHTLPPKCPCPTMFSKRVLGHFLATCWSVKYQGQGWSIPISPQSLPGAQHRAGQNIKQRLAEWWWTHCKTRQTTLLSDPIESSTQHRRDSEKQICLINQAV